MSDRVSWAAESANHMPGAFHCTQTPTMHFVNGRYAGPDGVFHIIKTTFPDFSFEYRISFYLKSMESADVFGTGPRVVKPEIANGCHLLDHLDTSEGTVLTKSWRTDTICKSGCGHEECVEFTKTPLRRQSEELKAANVMEGRFHDNQVEIGKFKGGVPVSRNRLGNVEDDDVLGSRERKRASLM